MNTRPKDKIVAETREIINQPKDIERFNILGLDIHIFPEVFNPNNFFSSRWFAKELHSLVQNTHSFLEVGCGTGIISLFLAKENSELNIFCTDLMEEAKENTKYNSEINNLSSRVHVFSGDVFDGLPPELKVDAVFWALPFGFLEGVEILTGRDRQVFDPGYRAIKKFFNNIREKLNEGGNAYIGFSDAIGDKELLNQIAKENQFELVLISESYGTEKSKVDMKIYKLKG